jgi:hypothetical protein
MGASGMLCSSELTSLPLPDMFLTARILLYHLVTLSVLPIATQPTELICTGCLLCSSRFPESCSCTRSTVRRCGDLLLMGLPCKGPGAAIALQVLGRLIMVGTTGG